MSSHVIKLVNPWHNIFNWRK